jgi:hypothetical protein
MAAFRRHEVVVLNCASLFAGGRATTCQLDLGDGYVNGRSDDAVGTADGTTHVALEPLDFIARLAALVPPPRRHLTRYHGVFAPNSRLRALITPAGRGSGKQRHRQQGARRREAKAATPCGDAVGLAAQAGVRHRDRYARALRHTAEARGEHRGPRGDCAHPCASGSRIGQGATAAGAVCGSRATG